MNKKRESEAAHQNRLEIFEMEMLVLTLEDICK